MRNYFCAFLLCTLFVPTLNADQSSPDTVTQAEFQALWEKEVRENPQDTEFNDAIREVCHGRAAANDYRLGAEHNQHLALIEKSRDAFLASPFEYTPQRACSVALEHYLRGYFVQR